MSKLWNLLGYVKWYHFATMVNEQLRQQKLTPFFSLSSLPRQLILHAVFVYLSHLMVPYVQTSASHQAFPLWCHLKEYKI